MSKTFKTTATFCATTRCATPIRHLIDKTVLWRQVHRCIKTLKKYIKRALIPLSKEKQRSRYTDLPLSGLGKLPRSQLAALLRQSTGTLSPAMAATVLSLSRTEAAKLLSRRAAQGWLQRVRRGFLLDRYAPEEQKTIKQCARSLTQGYTQFDPALPARKFVTAWRLSLPEGWKAR